MREGSVEHIDRSPIDKHALGGTVSSNGIVPSNFPTTGFTAVNGDSQRTISFRPDEAGKSITMPSHNDDSNNTAVTSSSAQSYGWRPDDWTAPVRVAEQANTGNKRKRPRHVEGEDESEADSSARGSPKRRTLPTSDRRHVFPLDSSVELSSAEVSATDRRPPDGVQVAPSSREQSPIPRWKQSEPPPKPRPETEASLAESLSKFQRTQQAQERTQQAQERTQQAQEKQPPPARPRSPSPPAAVSSPPPPAVDENPSPEDQAPEQEQDQEQEQEQQDSLAGDNEQLQDQDQDDPLDPKKRKRNFSNRTKTGCHTCRYRKKKCDEGRPTCNNCSRGGFTCGGYGPKPPGYKLPGQTRQVPLQSKAPPYEPSHGPTGYWPTPEEAGRSYSHWGRAPPPEPSEPPRPPYAGVDSAAIDPRRPPPSREGWLQSPWRGPELQHPYTHERLPPPPGDFSHVPPPPPPPPPLHAHHTYSYGPHPAPSLLPPPPSLPFEGTYIPSHPDMQYRPPPPPGPPSLLSSRESLASSSHRGLATYGLGQQSEKDKMLRGQPYLHWKDNTLVSDRLACAGAVERYNRVTDSAFSGISGNEKARLFTQILHPHKRPGYIPPPGSDILGHLPQGPAGSIDDDTIVETPFKCDYGYNIHIGRECIISSGCHMQDAADISIGHRVIVGPNVKFYTLSTPNSPSNRGAGGNKGVFTATAIRIEDDVFIGGDAIIMPSVTVGRGAVVGAGSVVTRDVKEDYIVAGNPAKRKRKIEAKGEDRHADDDIEEQHVKMRKKQDAFVRSGFSVTSPDRVGGLRY